MLPTRVIKADVIKADVIMKTPASAMLMSFGKLSR